MRLAMKPGRVLAEHDALAQAHVGEARDASTASGRVAGPAHDLQQAHIARRIEEVGDEEVARRTLAGMPSVSFFSGMVEVLEETIEPGFRIASSRR